MSYADDLKGYEEPSKYDFQVDAEAKRAARRASVSGASTPMYSREAEEAYYAACDAMKDKTLAQAGKFNISSQHQLLITAFIELLCKQAHEISTSKGFYDVYYDVAATQPPEIAREIRFGREGLAMSLIHGEVTEAVDEMRQDTPRMDKHLPQHPAFNVELADVVIRCFDFAGLKGIPLGRVILDKMAYNDSRPRKHGGKTF